jgi:hypothetical protein
MLVTGRAHLHIPHSALFTFRFGFAEFQQVRLLFAGSRYLVVEKWIAIECHECINLSLQEADA